MPTYNFGMTWKERFYNALETTFGVLPSAAFGATNAIKMMNLNIKKDVETIVRPDKTGTRSPILGQPGHRSGSFTGSFSMAPGSAAGVVPDADPIYQAAFGQAATIVAATSATYNLSDNVLSFSAGSYRTPSALIQRIGVGGLLRQIKFSLGKNVAQCDISGTFAAVIDSENIGTLTDGDFGKGGITGSVFPAEPGSQTYNGNMIVGYKGFAQVGANTLVELQDAMITMDVNNSSPLNVFGSDYGTIAIGGKRATSVALNLFDSDSTGAKAIRSAAEQKTPTTITIEVGNVVGARFNFVLSNVMLSYPDITEDGDRFSDKVADSPATITGGTPNEIVMKVY